MSIVKLSNNGVKNATAFGSITGLGDMVFIKKVTASSSGTVSFVDGSSDVVLDNTYKEYLFTYNNIHPSADQPNFTFQGSTNSGSSYGINITSSVFNAYHSESDSEATLEYSGGSDLAQSTSYQRLVTEVNNANDGSVSGMLHLFDPSNDTFVKHFIAKSQGYSDASGVTENPYSWNMYIGGYFNTTSAIDAIQFKFTSGNIDAGDICLYGIN